MPTSIYPYLEHPLVLTGAVLFGVLGIFKLLLSSGILLPPAQKEVAPILHKVLNFGFVLAVIVVVLGFGLEFWRIYKQLDQIRQAKQSIMAELLTNITSIDERLGYIEKTLEPNTFHQQLDSVRKKVAPGLRSQFASGYTRVLIEQKIATLRQMLNSSPLRTGAGRSELENLHRSGVDTEKYHKFYNQLAEVERVTEDFFFTLAYVASMSDEPSDLQAEYNNERLELAMWNTSIESEIAYVLALQVLLEVTKSPHPVPLPESVQTTLQMLNYLQPRKLPASEEEVNTLLAGLIEQKSALVTEKASLMSMASQLSKEKLCKFEQINQIVKINPTDTWNQVIGKAVSLRQLGRTAEAIAAFSRYTDMFSATDPKAKQYAHTAQQFTIQLDLLGVQGGAYIFEVRPESIAQQAGLKEGDIIIEYNGHTITDMSIFVEAAKSARSAETVQITWLRLTAQDKFDRYIKTLPGESLGVGTMPI